MTPCLRPPLSLYIHVPLCVSKCAYCDFYSLPRACADLPSQDSLVEALLARARSALDLYLPRPWPPLETLYIGGGTPTALDPGPFHRLVSGLASLVGPCREWTLEANPESLDETHLDIALEAGVSRISLGVQSLDDGLLSRLGRPADSRTALLALRRAASRPGLRVSADLIAGLPRSLPLEDEAHRLLGEGIEHLSLYDLTVEEATPLAAQIREGRFILPDPDSAYEEVQRAGAVLAKVGFRRYEVSNWSRPGAESLHNRAYWRLDSYLGLGPGGVSTLQMVDDPGLGPGQRGGSLRLEEGRDIEAFVSDPEGRAGNRTELSPKDSAFEVILMGYRTIWGVDRPAFARRFGLELESLIGGTLAAWDSHLRPEGGLDDPGLDLLNAFLVDCLGELEASFPAPASL